MLDESLLAGGDAPALNAPDTSLAATTVEPSTGPVRDEHGRFASTPNETPDSAAATEPGPDDVPVVAADAALTPDTPVVEAAPVTGKPFSYRADGQIHSMDGVEEFDDGTIRVGPEAAHKIRTLISRGHHHDNGFHQRIAQEREAGQREVQRVQQEAKAYEQIAQLFLNAISDPERSMALASDPREQAYLKREALLLLRQSGVNPNQPQQSAAPAISDIGTWLEQPQNRDVAINAANEYAFELLEQDPLFAGIKSDEDKQVVFQALAEAFDDCFTIHNGQPSLDRVRMKRIMGQEARRVTDVRTVKSTITQQQSAAQAAANANAARDAKPAVPPAAATNRAAPATVPKSSESAKSWRQQRDEFFAKNPMLGT